MLDNKMRGEFASDEYLAKLKEEMDRGVELQDQLLTSKRDVHMQNRAQCPGVQGS